MRLERWLNFKIQAFIYINEEEIARMFIFSVNKICKSYCYTQLCNYREQFVFKPISSQFNIVAGCNLSFTRSLNALPWNGWIFFSKLNAIKEFATSFSSLKGRELGRGSPYKTKNLNFPFSVGYHPHQKVGLPCPSPDHRPILEKRYL